MTLTAYNHVPIPPFMYGTAWKKEATTQLVLQAVDAGFTAIDTANQIIHYDEARVGEALLRLARKGVTRDRLFLQTKFTPVHGQDHRLPYDANASITTQVQQSFESSLAHLHTDYLDSYVLHGPYHRRGLGPEDWEVWTAIEALYDAGRTRMIGVSNVTAEQLAMLCDRAKHKPMAGHLPRARDHLPGVFALDRQSGSVGGYGSAGDGCQVRSQLCADRVPVRHADRYGAADRHHQSATHDGRSAVGPVYPHPRRTQADRDHRSVGDGQSAFCYVSFDRRRRADRGRRPG
jgi:hypothetical protein